MAYLETVNQGNAGSSKWVVAIFGNAGAALDAPTGNAVPANALLIGADQSGNIEPLSLDGSGYLEVNVKAGSTGNSAAGPTGSSVPADADYIGFNSGGNLVGVSSSNPLPITGSISATNPSVSATGSTVPSDATYIGANNPSGDLTGLLVNASGYLEVFIENSTLAVTQSGTWTVTAEIEGHAGGVLDAVIGASIPANAVLIGASQSGDIEPLLLNASGYLEVFIENSTLAVTQSGSWTVAIAASQTIAVTNAGTFAVQDSTSEGYLRTIAGAISSSQMVVSGTVTAEIEGYAGGILDGAAGSPSTQCVTVQGNSSGTPVPTLDACNGPVTPSTAAGNSALGGGVYESTPQTPTSGQQTALQQDARSSLYVNTEGRKPTYCAAIAGQTIITGINLVLRGSSTHTIRITRIQFSGAATTATGEYVGMGISSAPSGGTSATANIVQGSLDSNNSAATAAAQYYTAAPSAGTAQVTFNVFNYPFGTISTTPQEIKDFYFGQRPSQCPTLRGTTEYFFLEITGTPSGGVYSLVIEWTEE